MKQFLCHPCTNDLFFLLSGFSAGLSEKTPDMKASVAQLFREYEVPWWPHVLYCTWRTSALFVCTLTSLDVGRAVRKSEQVRVQSLICIKRQRKSIWGQLDS